MNQPKKCNCCGAVHTTLPADARYQAEYEQFYFECSCKSTLLYVPNRERTMELIRACAERSISVRSST